jgi:hypothetical protein
MQQEPTPQGSGSKIVYLSNAKPDSTLVAKKGTTNNDMVGVNGVINRKGNDDLSISLNILKQHDS